MGLLRVIGSYLNRGYRNDLNWNFQKLEELISETNNLTAETKKELLAEITSLREQLNSLNVDEILALIQQMQEKIIAANTAAILANEKAGIANDASIIANEKATLANTKAQYAQDKGDYADEKARLADEAATLANQESSNLGQLKNDVVNATQSANNAANSANQASTNANNAANAANNASNAITPILPNVEGLINRGTYSTLTNYKKNNIAEFNGSSFQALKDTVGNPPPTLPIKANEFWQLVAQRGVDGAGSVSTVNGKGPNVDGNVEVTAIELGAIGVSEKGVANGVATLDENSKIPLGHIPDDIGKVRSVNNKVGDIVLEAEDVGALPINTDFETPIGAQNKADNAETNAKNASIPIKQKGVAGGVATLDEVTGKVPPNQLDFDTTAIEQSIQQVQDNLDTHELEKATKTSYGHVKIGEGIDVSTEGVISVSSSQSKINPVCSVNNGSILTVPNITYFFVPFDNTVVDNKLMLDTTDKTKIVCKENGVYMINAELTLYASSGDVNFRKMIFRKNNTDIYIYKKKAYPDEDIRLTGFYVTRLNLNDFIQLVAVQETNNSLSMRFPALTITKIAD